MFVNFHRNFLSILRCTCIREILFVLCKKNSKRLFLCLGVEILSGRQKKETALLEKFARVLRTERLAFLIQTAAPPFVQPCNTIASRFVIGDNLIHGQ